jgi:hypothetical protein
MVANQSMDTCQPPPPHPLSHILCRVVRLANSLCKSLQSHSGTVLPRNKLTLRFGCGSCGCGRAVFGRCSCGLQSLFVRFAVAVCAVFSPTAENHGVVFRRFPTTTIIIRFLITRFIFRYCDYICRSLLYTM